MEDNPFSKIVKVIRQDNMAQMTATFRIGTIISEDPVILDVAGTIQDEKSVLKNSLINRFEVGDKLLLAPIEEEQRYIIICKVVSI
ncbi:MAG: hypothetical protein K0R50_237 [Eubacterium sp.]|jgi:hypothetical protein|nr:hypothetical protein [Eubacterium sp.]